MLKINCMIGIITIFGSTVVANAQSLSSNQLNNVSSNNDLYMSHNKIDPLGSSESLNSSLEIKAELLFEQIEKNSIPISLEKALQTAIKTNPQLTQAYREIQATQWEKIAIRRQWIPTLNLESYPLYGGYYQTTYIDSLTSTPIDGTSAENGNVNFSNTILLSPIIGLQWTFFDAKRGASIAAKSSTIQQQKFLFNSSARSLALNVSRAYYNVQGAQILVKQYQKLYQTSRKALDAVTAQMNIGVLDIGVSSQIATQYYTNLNNYYIAVSNLVDQSAELASLLNFSNETYILASDPMAPNLDWKLSLSESIIRAKAFNDEILAAYADVNSLNWQAKSLMNAYYPELFIFGQGQMYQYRGVQSAPLGNDDAYSSYNISNKQYVANIGIGATWSFDGGVSAANSMSFRKKAQAAEAKQESTLLSVVSNIKSAYGTYQALNNELESVEKGLDAAKLNQEVTEAKYGLGLSDVTTLVQSLQLYSSAIQQQVSTLINLNSAVAELYRYTSIWPSNTVNAFQARESTLSKD